MGSYNTGVNVRFLPLIDAVFGLSVTVKKLTELKVTFFQPVRSPAESHSAIGIDLKR